MVIDFWQLRIDPERLKADFDALSEIGATGDGGVNRPALSPAHLAARRWFEQRARAEGFEFLTDGAGNHSARLKCATPEAPWLLLGSHLDSVPNGGRFDGALGVLAGLETLRVVRDANLRLPANLEVIDFTDEEGTLVGLLGSSALAGNLHPEDLQAPRGGREALEQGFSRAGLVELDLFTARRDPGTLAGYLELHIEQGPRLAAAGADIGVVTAIVGIASYRLTFTGEANHAGTTPMQNRRDASLGACSFTLAARETVLQRFPSCVVNVGSMQFSPGAFNIVPSQASLALEFRAPQADLLDELERVLLDTARSEARRFDLSLEAELLGKHTPSMMSPLAIDSIEQAAKALGLRSLRMASGAGHDAQSLAALCPAGMIFVPSAGGASHAPREFTAWQDCMNGANTLLLAVLQMMETIQG